MSLYSAFEQFEAVVIQYLPNFVFITLSALVIIYLVVLYVTDHATLIPSYPALLVGGLMSLVMGLVRTNAGASAYGSLPWVFSLFTLVLTLNLVGLIPYSFTVSSLIPVTFWLSTWTWIAKLIVGFRFHGLALLSLLYPPSAPFAALPAFVLIEFISFIVPVISMATSLFANMLSGRVLLKVIVSFTWLACSAGFLGVLGTLVALPLLLALFALETGVAFIQAYVITLLTTIYLGDVITLSH